MTKPQIAEKIEAELNAMKPYSVAIQLLEEARDQVARRRVVDPDLLGHVANVIAISRGIREAK